MYFPDISTLISTTTGPVGVIMVWALPALGAIIAILIAGKIAKKVRGIFPRLAGTVLGTGGRRGRRRR